MCKKFSLKATSFEYGLKICILFYLSSDKFVLDLKFPSVTHRKYMNERNVRGVCRFLSCTCLIL